MVPTPNACVSSSLVAVCRTDGSVSCLLCTGEERQETLFAHCALGRSTKRPRLFTVHWGGVPRDPICSLCTGEESQETPFAHCCISDMCLGLTQLASVWISDVSVFLEVGYLGARPCLTPEHTRRRQIPCFYSWCWPRSRFNLSCHLSKRTMLPSCWVRYLLLVIFFRVKAKTISKDGLLFGFPRTMCP